MTEWLAILQSSPLGAVFVFVLGLIFGSFFNVCILRIPDEKSLVPGSACPKCKAPIRWYHNIPVVSFLWLRGRCHQCKKPISIQYPLVEIATGVLFFWLYLHFGLNAQFLAYAIFLSILIVISVIDLYHQIIPDELSIPGIVLGFLMLFLTKDITWQQSLLGIFFGGGIFLGIATFYEKLTKREGLGGGDVKMLAMIGAWLGYQSILPVIIISSALGSIVGLLLMGIGRRDFRGAIPFGPFLALGGVVQVFWGREILSYLMPMFVQQ